MALVQYDLYLYIRGLGYTDGVEGKRDEEMQGEDGHLQGRETWNGPSFAAPRRT